MRVAFNPSKIAHNFTVVSAIEAWYETSQELTFDVSLIVELCRGWKFLNETSHNALGLSLRLSDNVNVNEQAINFMKQGHNNMQQSDLQCNHGTVTRYPYMTF